MFERIVLNRYTLIIAATIIVISSIFFGYKHQIKKAAEAAKIEQQDKQIAAYNADLAKSLNTSKALISELQTKIKELEDDKKSIEHQRNVALDSLRNRPTRIEYKERTSSNPSSAPKTCTGAELSREDAEFLTRESAAASLIAKERDFYYERYEQSRIRLEALSGELN